MKILSIFILFLATSCLQSLPTATEQSNASSVSMEMTEAEVIAFAESFHSGLVDYEAGLDVMRAGVSKDAIVFNANMANPSIINLDAMSPRWFWEDKVECDVKSVHIYGNVASVYGRVTYSDFGMLHSKSFHGTVVRENGDLVWHRWMEIGDQLLSNNYLGVPTRDPELFQIWVESAWHLIDGQFEEAYKKADLVLEKNPSFSPGYVVRAWRALLEGDEDGWNSALETAIENFEAETYPQRLYIRSMAAKGTKESELLAQEAVAIAPDDPLLGLWYVFALTIFSENPNYELATWQMNRLLNRWPTSGGVHNAMGYVQMLSGNLEAAEKHFKMYLRVNPDTANAYDSMGDFLSASGKLEEARKSYERAIELSSVFKTISQKKIDELGK